MDHEFTGAKGRIFGMVLMVFAVVLTIGGAELAVRLVKQFGRSTFVFRRYDPQLGTALIPGTQGKHQNCYDGYVFVNAHGMRDSERERSKPEGTFRIGVFGDSFTEAVHVRPDETAPKRLEERLNDEVCDGNCEVLNFSVASYSTVQEYQQYLELGQQFDLDLALLVTIPNDLIANVDPGNVQAGSFYHAPFLRRSGGAFELLPAKRPPFMTTATAFLARRSDLALYVSKIYYHMIAGKNNGDVIQTRAVLTDRAAVTANAGLHPIYGLYDTTSVKSAEAWDAFEFMLHKFRRAAGERGSEFAVAFVEATDAFWWYPTLGEELPSTIVPSLGKQRYEQFHIQTGVRVHDLGAAIAEFIQVNGLQAPYLSFSCNPHFDRQGNTVVANSLFDFLTRQDLIRLPGKAVTTHTPTNMARSASIRISQ